MKRLAIGVFGFLAAVPALADIGSGDAYGPHMGYGGYDAFGMFLGPVFMLVLLAALVVATIAFIQWITPGAGRTGGGNNALEALNMRLAQGEMDAKEYEERKKLLMG